MDILSEKPIADTWEACRDIYSAVTRARLKMQVVQNYRYYRPMLTLREVLRRGDLGRINYIMARFAKDYRVYGSWGAIFRHEIRHSLLIEAAEDPLTGALNRRGILASLDGVLLSHVRQQQPISVFMIDLDRFKVINDKFGHSAGDRALTWVTSKMREMLRSGDLLGRYGGDEFLMILPGTTKIQAQQIAQRMAQSIHEVASREAAYPTISIGIGSAPEDGRDATSLIEAADTALYGAKDRRRNDAAPGNPNAA